MVMTGKELQQYLRESNAELTLFNDYGESYYAGLVREVRSHRSKIVLRFNVEEQPANASPFTWALLHNGKKVLNAQAIKSASVNLGDVVELSFEK